MTGAHSLGGVCDHNKAYGLALFPDQREFRTEGLLDRHALGMLGRTLILQMMSIHSQPCIIDSCPAHAVRIIYKHVLL